MKSSISVPGPGHMDPTQQAPAGVGALGYPGSFVAFAYPGTSQITGRQLPTDHNSFYCCY